MTDPKLDAARELIEEKKYAAAHALLTELPKDDPEVIKLLAKSDALALTSKPQRTGILSLLGAGLMILIIGLIWINRMSIPPLAALLSSPQPTAITTPISTVALTPSSASAVIAVLPSDTPTSQPMSSTGNSSLSIPTNTSVTIPTFTTSSAVIAVLPSDTPTSQPMSSTSNTPTATPTPSGSGNAGGIMDTLSSNNVAVGVVDPDQQVNVTGGGGSGGCGAINNQNVTFVQTGFDNYCIRVTFPVDTPVDIAVYRPDGTLYNTGSSTVYKNDVNETVADFHLSLNLGSPLGTWTVKASYNGKTQQAEFYLTLPREPHLAYGCDSNKPELSIMGFAPSQTVDVVLVSFALPTDAKNLGFYQAQAKPVFHWKVTVGPQGYLVAHLNIPIVSTNVYYFILPNFAVRDTTNHIELALGTKYYSCTPTPETAIAAQTITAEVILNNLASTNAPTLTSAFTPTDTPTRIPTNTTMPTPTLFPTREGVSVTSTLLTRSGVPVNLINDSDPGITYYGGDWTQLTGRGLGDYQDDVHYATTDGATFTYSFTGTGIDYFTEKNSDEGNIDIYIDKAFQQTVSASNATRQVRQMVYSKTGLASGSHTLTGVKKSGQYILVDAFGVYSSTTAVPTLITRVGVPVTPTLFPTRAGVLVTLTSVPTRNGVPVGVVSATFTPTNMNTLIPTKTYPPIPTQVPISNNSGNGYNLTNDSDSHITYSGASWTHLGGRGLGDYQDDVHYATTDGDSFTYSFTGTGIDYITEKNNDEGNIDIYIDKAFQQTVSAYSATRLTQQKVYSTRGLTSGFHMITGVKKSGQYLLVDAFGISTNTSNPPAATQPPSNNNNSGGGNNAGSGQASCPGFSSRLAVGMIARVIPGPANRLRSAPSTSGQLISQIPGGDTFKVIDGPTCGENILWWKVDYNGTVGWTAEGQGNTYWLEPIK